MNLATLGEENLRRYGEYVSLVFEGRDAHPAVAETAVVGTADALMGEDVLAFVVAKNGASVTADALIAFCQDRLAKYKCPRQVRFVDALPKSPIGKILREELRAQAR